MVTFTVRQLKLVAHLINELDTNNPMIRRRMRYEEIVGSVQLMSKDTESDDEDETVCITKALESLNNVCLIFSLRCKILTRKKYRQI